MQNYWSYILGELLEENTSMREKLGISPRGTSTSGIPHLQKQSVEKRQQQEARALMQVHSMFKRYYKD